MAIVRKDKLLAGYNGNLESVIVHDADGKELEITNGVLVTVGGLAEGQREVKKAVLASDADADKDILLIHNPEVMYDERLSKLSDFKIEAGQVARAYRLYDGDIFTLTVDLFDSEPSVGDTLTPVADGKLGAGDGTEKVVFTVIEDSGYELDINQKAYAVEVSRN